MFSMQDTLQENVSQLKFLIEKNIKQLNYDTAEWFAELLYSELYHLKNDSLEKLNSVYYYSLVLYLKRDYLTSMSLVKPLKNLHLGCSYIFARCALDKSNTGGNEIYIESIQSLLSLREQWDSLDSSDLYAFPESSTIYHLLGRLYLKINQNLDSTNWFSKSLKLDPYLYDSVYYLCTMQADLKILKLFKSSRGKRKSNAVYKPQTPFKVPSRLSSNSSVHINSINPNNSNTSSLLTYTNTNSNGAVPSSPSVMMRSKFIHPHQSANTPSKLSSKFNVQSLSIANLSTTHKPLDKLIYWLLKAFKSFCRYDSYKAIRILNTQLPNHIINEMPWCISLLGKLHFEIVNYDMSFSYFQKLHELQPTRFRDMDIYSTLLWHLNDKIRLSHLCHELMSFDDHNPITWCCMGNLFSLNKDHDESIKSLKKAVQLNSEFTYAYTLRGHEYLNNDAFDQAKTCYRKSLSIQPLHYNAHYGLGMTCIKLGQYEEALLHFEKARSINPINVILNCCCGVALERLGHQDTALEFYELACQLQPSSSLALFKKSQLLFNLGQYSNSLQTFEKLENLTPNEPSVHFFLGQLYQIVGRKNDAIKQFTIAMNLDPKANQLIKEALEKCHEQG